jgi:hypothetical protein
LGSPNLDSRPGADDFDRRHNLVLSGRIAEVPHTRGMTLSGTLRMLSGLAMSLIDTNSDPDRNGILADRCRPGTYSGNGSNAITVDNVAGATARFGPVHPARSRLGWRLKAGRPHRRPQRDHHQRHQSRELRQSDRGPSQHQLPAVDDALRRRQPRQAQWGADWDSETDDQRRAAEPQKP